MVLAPAVSVHCKTWRSSHMTHHNSYSLVVMMTAQSGYTEALLRERDEDLPVRCKTTIRPATHANHFVGKELVRLTMSKLLTPMNCPHTPPQTASHRCTLMNNCCSVENRACFFRQQPEYQKVALLSDKHGLSAEAAPKGQGP